MEKKLLKEAKLNNDVITFKKKDDDGLPLWYTGNVTGLGDSTFDFKSIYGNEFVFNITEVIDLKGPKVAYMDDGLDAFQGNKSTRKFLIFDTETTGLPKNYDAPLTDTENWPRVIQLSWSVHDDAGREIEHMDLIVKPDGFVIPPESTKIHGITTEMAYETGIPLKKALETFSKSVNNSDVLVAHNISFDEKVMGCEFFRENMENVVDKKAKICTKEASVDFCKIPGRGGRYSWASLDDLYIKLFNQKFENQHNASSDVRACAKCFFELKRIGVVS